MTIGELIKQLRIQQGYKQKELAELAGIPTITLQQYERGVTQQPKIEQLSKIAVALKVSLSDLIVVIDSENEISYRVFFADGTIEDINETTNESTALSIKSYLLNNRKNAEKIVILKSDDQSKYCNDSQWIPIYQDGSVSLVPADKNAAMTYVQAFHEQIEAELLSNKDSIMQESIASVEKAMSELTDTVRRICKDDRAVSEAQQLHEAELMPARIGRVTDFIKCNADFLKGNMPGMVPEPADKK